MAHSAGRVHNERHLKKSLDEELSMTVKKYDDNDAAPTDPPYPIPSSSECLHVGCNPLRRREI